MPVTRCICANRCFTELRDLAIREKLNLDELAQRTNATLGCGRCKTYVQQMLATGQCTFPVEEAAFSPTLRQPPCLSTNAHQRVKEGG